MPRFVLNDETKTNSYGFRIPNKGIDLKRFKANPVMLNDHYNSTAYVLGKWNDIQIEGQTLTAEPEFDEGDEQAKKVQGKVDRGYIKGASLGLTFSREYMQQDPDGVWQLTKCEAYEASIVAIPANANALRLYAADTGKLMTEADIALCLSTLETTATDTNFNTNGKTMKGIQLSLLTLAALGFTGVLTENDGAALSASIEKMKVENDQLKAEKAKLEAQLKDQAKAQTKDVIDAAILAGKITEADREDFEGLSLAAVVKQLNRIPEKQTLGGSITNPAAGGNAATIKTADDFEKLSLDEQKTFKANNLDAYKKLFA